MKEKLLVSMDKEVKEKLKRMAKDQGRAMGKTIVQLIKDYKEDK